MILGIDFDGVLATEPPDPGYRMPRPAPGAIEAIRQLSRQHTIIIFTARAVDPGSRRSVEDWLNYYGLKNYVHTVTAIKFPWIDVFVDDRAYHFESWDSTLRELPGVLSKLTPARRRGAPRSVYAG